MRDIQQTVDVGNKWIDVLSIKARDRDVLIKGWHDFEWFVVELFPKKILPEYSSHMSDEEKKYVTWKTAQYDILMQRSKGYKGRKYIVFPYIDVSYITEERTRVTDITLEMLDPVTDLWIDCGHGPVPQGCEYRRKVVGMEIYKVKSEIREYKISFLKRIR